MSKKSILSAIVGFVFLIFAVEILLRVLDIDVGLDPALFASHPGRAYALNPAYQGPEGPINSFGLRGKGPAVQAGKPIILFMGDSFVFGQGVPVDAALPAVLEKEFREVGIEACVLNAGVPGYGTTQELDLLRELLPRVKPALVLLGVHAGTDFYDNDPVHLERIAERHRVGAGGEWGGGGASILRRLAHRVVLFDLLRSRTPRLLRERLLARAGGSRKWHILLRPYERRWGEKTLRLWSETRVRLTSFSHECQDGGIPVVFILMPDEIQVSPQFWMELVRIHGLDADHYDLDRPGRMIMALGDSLGVPTADLAPHFRRTEERLYSRHNRHWNVSGHEQAGKALARFLAENRVLSGLVRQEAGCGRGQRPGRVRRPVGGAGGRSR